MYLLSFTPISTDCNCNRLQREISEKKHVSHIGEIKVEVIEVIKIVFHSLCDKRNFDEFFTISVTWHAVLQV